MKEIEAVELKNEPTVQFQEIAKIFITSFDRPSYKGKVERATQERILACTKVDPEITRKQIAAKVGLTEDGIKYHLTKMTRSGAVPYVGSTKAGRWKVKR
jgi:predicted HTH transcriptional regulator